MIQLYDSLAQKKLPFEKALDDPVKIYVCGPTVYDVAHLGHGRSAVAFDLVRRTLEWLGYTVEFAFNITDIDDKMIQRANEEGISVAELTEKITPLYREDYAALGVKPATHNPYATAYIDAMIELIKKLEVENHTYVLADGVYFDITSFEDYGKLSHQKMEELNAGARIEKREDKRNHQDFVLWKFKKEGEPFWASPWGDGRPGWHIECSAMSTRLLGNTLDIHGGGLDLKFPHHECEIAQSEAAFKTPFARHWMHNGYITVNEEKMSKSLGNFFTLRDIFKEYPPRVVRFFLMGTHYRSPIEFSRELLDQARATLKGLDESYLNTKNKVDGDKSGAPNPNLIQKIKVKLSNDIDVAGALAELFSWLESEAKTLDPKSVLATLEDIDQVFNIFPSSFLLNEEQKQLIEERQKARSEKDWEKADDLREQLTKQGIEVEDRPEGPLAKPKI